MAPGTSPPALELPIPRVEYVRYRAAWRFSLRASWDRLQASVTLTWFLGGLEIRGRLRILLPSTGVMGGVLSIATLMGKPVSIEVRAVARDALGSK